MSEVNVITPTGEIGNIPEAELPNAIKYGYRPATAQEILGEQRRIEYGEGFGNELAAGLEGAASGATFGLSRHLENILGIATPEEQAARKEFNPTASGAGEIAGILGSAVLMPGTSLPGLVSKGAAKAGAGLAERAFVSQAAKTIAAKTIAGGLEGLAYGTAAPISESALGDPTLTAQKAFQQIGMGALIGGAIGGGIGALGVGAKKFFPKVEPIKVEPTKTTGEFESVGTGEIKPQGPVKLEGTVDFGMPDEKLLKQAEKLNPQNPLNQNDLDFLKTVGAADDTGKPTVFNKIGTDELPTLNNAAKGQVTIENKVGEGMKKLQDTNIQLDAMKENILRDSPVTLSKEAYKDMIQKEIVKVNESGMAGDEIGQQAIKRLEATLEAADNLPDTMDAMQIKQRLSSLRDSGRIYTKSGGLKDDFVSETYRNVEHSIDGYLKENIPEYKALMKEYAPLVNLSKKMEKHLNWDFDQMSSNLKSDWIDNRIVKPFQSELYGNKGGGFSADAKLLREFGDFIGVDLDKAVKTNLVYGKINPGEALGSQGGTWGARVAEGLGALAHPTEIPGKLLKGTAKIALTGELPDFIQNIRSKGVQDLLLGKSSPGVADRILSKMGSIDIGSKLLNAPSAVPLGVKVQQFIDSHDSMDEADQKLEVLTALEKAQRKADLEIQSTVDGIFSGKTGKAGDSYNGFMSQPVKESSEEIDKLSKQVNELLSDPTILMDKLTATTQGLGKHAPQVTAGLNMTAIRALNMLGEKINAIMPKDQLPLDPKNISSKNQLLSIAKTLKYINSPTDVLKEIQSGMISMEGKEVLQKVYPEYLQEMKAKLLSGISEAQAKGKKIPNSKRMGLSFFLGQQLDSSLKPQSIQANQAVYAAPMPTQNTPRPSTSRPDAAGRMLTPMQKIASK